MKALYLKDNDQIASGSKTAIATHTQRLTPGSHALVVKTEKGYQVTGNVEIGEPQTISLKAFDERIQEHRVTLRQRLQWWPEAKSLILYPLTYSAMRNPQVVDIAPGATMEIELREVGLKNIATVDGYYIYEVE